MALLRLVKMCSTFYFHLKGMDYGDEYLAELDHIEVVERAKDGYESDVPELRDKSYDANRSVIFECVSAYCLVVKY